MGTLLQDNTEADILNVNYVSTDPSCHSYYNSCSYYLDLPLLNSFSTLENLNRAYFTVPPDTIGALIAREFEQQADLPGVIVCQNSILLAMISRRVFLERLSQPYGIELFLKRPIEVFLSIATINAPLVLPETERIDRSAHIALQRTIPQIYEPIVVKGSDGSFSLLDFQKLILAQSQLLSLQRDELTQKSQQIEVLNSQLSWQANHDPLTHLINRRAFEQQIEAALQNLLEQGVPHILCYIDLDRFKVINDSCGHIAGDELLKQVASLMQNSIRRTDIVGRLGGDEFALLLHQCSLDDGIYLSNFLRQNLENLRFVWDEKIFRIGASIGLVIMDDPSVDMKELLKAADSACYMAKNCGRNRIYIYEANDGELLKQRTTVNSLTELQRAIEANRLCLYSQPIISLAALTAQDAQESELTISRPNDRVSDRVSDQYSIAAYEIFLRVKDDEGHILLPSPFLVAAERYKLMHQIDRWVIQNLFHYLGQIKSPECALYMINLSGETLRDEEFPRFVQQQMEMQGISPHILCFEITETVAITNFSQAEKFIRHLRGLGCHFALDDFGSGMSSFTYLKHFAVDFLKIDAMFVRDIARDSVDLSIVKAIHEVGHSIGLKTIAEGIEDLEALSVLKSLNVEYAQGFAIAHPQALGSVL